MLRAVGGMHLEAQDLVAVMIRNQSQLKRLIFDRGGQKRDVPAIDLPGLEAICVVGGRKRRCSFARPRRFIWPCARGTRWKLDSLEI